MLESFFIHFNYDVFLSFRGEDTRYNFTGNLYNAFCRRGINAFLDDQKLRIGDEISPSLLKAIEESRISIVVFSENYASSTWCLDELVKILECMDQKNHLVWPIFYKVDPSDIRHQRNSYDRAMIAHEIRFGKDSEKLCNWRSALTKVANLKGEHFKIGNEYEYDFIDSIVKKVSTTLPSKGLYVGKHLVGFEPRLKEVISLLDISSHSTVCMLGIHGIGGIGKTTLAKALYNSIVCQFEYASFLSDIRETSNQYRGLISLQETLLSKMFNVEDVKLSSVDEGAFEIKNRLQNRRVLLVLDDVNCNKQLEKLAGECNWFGSGSRIIVTTRDKHLLHLHQFEKTYEMEELNDQEALELFCQKAFNSSQPLERFVGLSKKVVNYACGLPLALEVIGSNLSGKDLDECKSALDRYKRIPDKNIQGILRISYDGLEGYQKDIFLDIACFFNGYIMEDVKKTLDACYSDAKYDIGVLIDKSLITVDKYRGYIQMHDIIQDMGREVVREAAPKDPRRRSRLWFDEDVVKVLEENSGTTEIEGIMLNSHQQKIEWNGKAFKKMKNLRMLIIRNVSFSVGPKYLPNSLRVLEWEQCPLLSLPPSFDPKRLVILKMPHSCLKLEKSFKKFKYLSMMDFSHCQFITEMPDMSGCSALKKLSFSYCKNLVKVHDSVGFLTKVTFLDLTRCENLTIFPSAIQMTSLQELSMHGCTSLEEVLDMSGCSALKKLNFSYCKNLVKVHDSVGFLTKVTFLDLTRCENLTSFPSAIQMTSLQELSMHGCTSLEHFPDILGNMDCLEIIWASKTAIKELPNSIGNLTRLQVLKLTDCNLVSIPRSITKLTNLLTLDVSQCKKLQEIYEIPFNLYEIRAVGCTSLTLQSASVIWSQAIKHICALRCVMPGAQIPDWFNHRCEGGNLSFWARGKVPDVAFASIISVPYWVFVPTFIYKVFICFNGGRSKEIFTESFQAYEECHVYVQDLFGIGYGLDRYVVHEWNCVEIEVKLTTWSGEPIPDITLHQSGLYVYKQGTSMEDVRFECPNSIMSAEMVPRNVLKRGVAFDPDNEPPKKVRRKQKPCYYIGKFLHLLICYIIMEKLYIYKSPSIKE